MSAHVAALYPQVYSAADVGWSVVTLAGAGLVAFLAYRREQRRARGRRRR